MLKSGRRKAQVMEDARLIGQSSYIYEVGSGVVIDGEETLLCGEFAPRDGHTPHELIAATGAPALLERTFDIEPHAPWHVDRFVSHLYRGVADVAEANELLAREGHDGLRLIDNGAARGGRAHLPPDPARRRRRRPRCELHMRARGFAPEECIAVGDSLEDLGVAPLVGTFFVVANGPARAGRPNVDAHRIGLRRRLLRGRRAIARAVSNDRHEDGVAGVSLKGGHR